MLEKYLTVTIDPIHDSCEIVIGILASFLMSGKAENYK